MTLLAAAVQHLYNEHQETDLSYHDILEKELLEPSGIFLSQKMPEVGACSDPKDGVSRNFLGGPAGGYWATTEDLVRFGHYLQSELYIPHPDVQELFTKYGQEFYQSDTEEIAHRGELPNSSAYFCVSMQTGLSWVTLSDKPQAAITLYNTCLEQLECDTFEMTLGVESMRPEVTPSHTEIIEPAKTLEFKERLRDLMPTAPTPISGIVAEDKVEDKSSSTPFQTTLKPPGTV